MATIAIGRTSALFFVAPLGAREVRAAVREGLDSAATHTLRALADAGGQAWLARLARAASDAVAEQAPVDHAVEQAATELEFESVAGLSTLRALGLLGVALGLLGATWELIWMLTGDHGLLGLVAGLPEQVATRAAVQAVANGLAIGWVAFSFRPALSRRARRLRRDVGSLRDLLAGRLGGLA